MFCFIRRKMGGASHDSEHLLPVRHVLSLSQGKMNIRKMSLGFCDLLFLGLRQKQKTKKQKTLLLCIFHIYLISCRNKCGLLISYYKIHGSFKRKRETSHKSDLLLIQYYLLDIRILYSLIAMHLFYLHEFFYEGGWSEGNRVARDGCTSSCLSHMAEYSHSSPRVTWLMSLRTNNILRNSCLGEQHTPHSHRMGQEPYHK